MRARELRGGLIGCGFFARNHLNAWNVVEGARIVALCDREPERARSYAEEFRASRTYADAAEMLGTEQLDFVDIITQPDTHRPLVELAAAHGVHVICQKPMAPALEDARAMVAACRDAGVRFMVHENFRWQRPMRAMKDAVPGIGELFFGRVSFRSAYDVYRDQPYLAEDPRFIIADVGVHLLDVARFFLGEVTELYCRTQRVNPRINGEDVATMLLRTAGGATCIVDLSYASYLEQELFPQTLVTLEGQHGSLVLGANYALTVVGRGGKFRRDVSPHQFSWSTPPAHAVQESVLAIQQHWVECLRTGAEPETSGEDNLKVMELVHGAYRSAESGEPFRPGG